MKECQYYSVGGAQKLNVRKSGTASVLPENIKLAKMAPISGQIYSKKMVSRGSIVASLRDVCLCECCVGWVR